jgi:hypothetical protein
MVTSGSYKPSEPEWTELRELLHAYRVVAERGRKETLEAISAFVLRMIARAEAAERSRCEAQAQVVPAVEDVIAFVMDRCATWPAPKDVRDIAADVRRGDAAGFAARLKKS